MGPCASEEDSAVGPCASKEEACVKQQVEMGSGGTVGFTCWTEALPFGHDVF